MTGRQSTIKEVANLAGVAASSVSRALNDHPDVSSAMKPRVLQAAKELGYQPDFLAQSLRLGTTRTIGFIVRDISNPLFAGIVKGAEEELESNGYSILLMNSRGDSNLDAKHIDVLRQRRVDGLILSLQSETSAETTDALRQSSSIPTVLLDRVLASAVLDAVLFDHYSGVSEATTDLTRLGHRRISLILGPEETRGFRERLKGFRSACDAAGIPPEDGDLVEAGTFSRDSGHEAAIAVLDRPDPPTAIIAGNSQVGVGVLVALNEKKLRHGHDITLVVCDDIELFRFMDPPISVVARDPEKMGAIAARLLLDRLDNGDLPIRNVILPTSYVARGSSLVPQTAEGFVSV